MSGTGNPHLGFGTLFSAGDEKGVKAWARAANVLDTFWARQPTDYPGVASATFNKMHPAGYVCWPVERRQEIGADGLVCGALPARLSDDGKKVYLLDKLGEDTDTDVARPMEVGKEIVVADGTAGIVVRGAALGTAQNHIFFPASGPLWAHNRHPKAPEKSSMVKDYDEKDQSKTIEGGLHTVFRVAKLPRVVSPPFKMNETDTVVALNWAESGGQEANGSTSGYGLIALPAKAGRTQSPQARKLVAYGFAAYEKTKGPFTVGIQTEGNRHFIGSNNDGERMYQLAIHTDAIFTDESDALERNAPIEFSSGTENALPLSGTVKARAEIVWDRQPKHINAKGQPVDGKWRIRYKLNDIQIEPGLTPYDPHFGGGDGDGDNVRINIRNFPPFRWGPGEQAFSSWFPQPRPCIQNINPPKPRGPITGAGRSSQAKRDSVYQTFGFTVQEAAAMPFIAHVVSTAQLTSVVPISGIGGILSCPPAYTRPPETIALDAFPIPGTGNGILHFAPPELFEHQLRHDFSDYPSAVSTPTYNVYSSGSAGGGNAILGFGRASSDLGSVVDGWRMFVGDGTGGTTAGGLYVRPIDADGALEATREFCVQGVFEATQGVCLPDGTEGVPSIFFCDDTDTGAYSGAANRFDIAAGGANIAWFQNQTTTHDFVVHGGKFFVSENQTSGHITTQIGITGAGGGDVLSLNSSVLGDIVPAGTTDTYNIGSTAQRHARLFMAVGSESAPAYTFGADPDTGMTRGGSANTLALVTGGSTAIAMTSSLISSNFEHQFEAPATLNSAFSPNVVHIDDTDSPYTVGVNDHIIVANAVSGAITINMLAADEQRELIVVRSNALGSNVTADADGSDTITDAGVNAGTNVQTVAGSKKYNTSGNGVWYVN